MLQQLSHPSALQCTFKVVYRCQLSTVSKTSFEKFCSSRAQFFKWLKLVSHLHICTLRPCRPQPHSPSSNPGPHVPGTRLPSAALPGLTPTLRGLGYPSGVGPPLSPSLTDETPRPREMKGVCSGSPSHLGRGLGSGPPRLPRPLGRQGGHVGGLGITDPLSRAVPSDRAAPAPGPLEASGWRESERTFSRWHHDNR